MGPGKGISGKEDEADKLQEIETRFTYHPPKEGQPAKFERIRAEAKGLALTIKELCPGSRESALAMTKLEEAVMWANAAIARLECSWPSTAWPRRALTR